MKIELIDHTTMQIEAESVSDHLYLTQFHGAMVKLILPKPFMHNSCKLEVKVVEELEPEPKKEEPKS